MTTSKFFSLLLAFFATMITSCKNQNTQEASDTNATTTEVTSSFKVWGNCEMCKETIEGAIKVNGVIKSDWNMDTKHLVVTYDSTKISLDQIQKNIAASGYDNEKYKAEEKAFRNLPECCQYERK